MLQIPLAVDFVPRRWGMRSANLAAGRAQKWMVGLGSAQNKNLPVGIA